MSDFKDLFRQAKANRGLSAKPTKEQIKALQAKKAAEQQQAARVAMPPPPPRAGPAPTSSSSRATAGPGSSTNQRSSGLPSDFFEQAAAASARPAPAVPAPSGTASASGVAATAATPSSAAAPPTARPHPVGRPAPASSQSAKTEGTATAVPAGFFDDKAADAHARGVKLPGKADKEAAFATFASEMEEDLQGVAQAEAEEAAEEAEARREREEHEQRLREERLQRLRERKAPSEDLQPDEAIVAALPAAKRRRMADMLAELEGGSGDEEGSDDDVGLVMDWRAKTV